MNCGKAQFEHSGLAVLQGEKGNPLSYVLNGSRYPAPLDGILTYENICYAAGYQPQNNPSTMYYYKKDKRSGIMTRGDVIAVEEGLIINCMVTGNA